MTELRLFRAAVLGMAIGITGLFGLTAGFGGLEAMAKLLERDPAIALDPGMRNHIRAFSIVFAGFGALGFWSTLALRERKGAFRILVLTAIGAGFGRLAGWATEGYPGEMALAFLVAELGVIPALFLWHLRLLRLSGRSTSVQ